MTLAPKASALRQEIDSQVKEIIGHALVKQTEDAERNAYQDGKAS